MTKQNIPFSTVDLLDDVILIEFNFDNFTASCLHGSPSRCLQIISVLPFCVKMVSTQNIAGVSKSLNIEPLNASILSVFC